MRDSNGQPWQIKGVFSTPIMRKSNEKEGGKFMDIEVLYYIRWFQRPFRGVRDKHGYVAIHRDIKGDIGLIERV